MITTDIPPNQTLFVSNLNHKIHLDDLKTNLFELFCPFGSILDIIAQKTESKCGQAFIVFHDIGASTNALRGLQGTQFLDRPIRINYAKTKSDAVAIKEGTYRPKKKEKRKERLVVKPANEVCTFPQKIVKTSVGGAKLFTLFVECLPDEMSDAAMAMLFKQYPGFTEVRLISGRNVAFVDYQTELQAETALRGLEGFLVTPQNALKISFAKTEE